MHEGHLVLLLQLQRVLIGIGIRITMQHHFRAATRDRLDLDLRRGGGHHDDGLAAELLCGKRHTLRMVPRRGGDHAALELLGRELRHFVVGAAQLERKHRLHILAFQQYRIANAHRQVGSKFQRCFNCHVIDARVKDAFQINHS